MYSHQPTLLRDEGSEVDSIEAEAEACIAEIDALITEASRSNFNDRFQGKPAPTVNPTKNMLTLIVLSVISAFATNDISDRVNMDVSEIMLCTEFLFAVIWVYFAKSLGKAKTATSSQVSHRALVISSVCILAACFIASNARETSTEQDIVLFHWFVPLVVLGLQSAVLDWKSPRFVVVCVTVISLSGFLYSWNGYQQHQNVLAVILAIFSCLFHSVLLICVRSALEHSGFTQAGALLFLAFLCIPVLMIHICITVDSSTMSVLTEAALNPTNMLLFVICCVLGLSCFISWLSCVATCPPITVAVLWASKDMLIELVSLWRDELLFTATFGRFVLLTSAVGMLWYWVSVKSSGFGTRQDSPYSLIVEP